jgi:hypothetical protein
MSCQRLFNRIFISAMILSCHFAFAQNAAKEVEGPKIKLAEASYNFGTAAQGYQVKHIFKFKNVGTDTLKIAWVKTSCGCTAAGTSKIIPPQKDGQIEVTYNTGAQSGNVLKTVYIFSNDVEAPQRSVFIHGTVEAMKADAPQN